MSNHCIMQRKYNPAEHFKALIMAPRHHEERSEDRRERVLTSGLERCDIDHRIEGNSESELKKLGLYHYDY